MSVSITSSLPRVINPGFKDNSGAGITAFEDEALPIHLPLSFLLTEWGPVDDAIMVGGSGFSSIFGSKSFDPTSPYFTHQAELIQRVLAKGNVAFIRRLVPADASSARFRLSLDVVEDDVPVYKRKANGTYELDGSGNPIPVTPAATVPGIRAKWVLQRIPTTAGVYQFGLGSPGTGSLVGKAGATSMLYPIWDLEVRFPGARGDDIGIRLAAPTLLSNDPGDADLVEEAGAFIYRFWAVKRQDSNSTAQVVTTMTGEQYVPFSFKPGVIAKATQQEYFVDDVVLPAYESTDPAEFNGYGLFNKSHVYHENIAIIQNQVFLTEEAEGTVVGAVTPEQTINILSATNVNGVPYHTFVLAGPADGGLLFSESSNHFALDGSDGTLSAAVYDQLVADELTAFGTGVVPYLDSAMYPFSTVYDSGYTLTTKKLLANILQRRDVWLNIATQDASQELNSPSAESSLAASLRAHFRATPESDYFGTSTCRVVVMGNAGKLIGSKYKGYLPFTVALAEKAAGYMGGSTGYMKNGYEFDSAPGNIVASYIEHNAEFKPEIARNRDWQNGLIFAQNYDRKSIFWPGLQTIYDDNTSVLNSYFNMVIACNLARIGERSWRRYTGNSKLTNDQFVQRVDAYISEQTNGRYDGRVDVVPRSYYTAFDEQRGYSWHTDITFRGQGMKTVETLTIISERREVAQ